MSQLPPCLEGVQALKPNFQAGSLDHRDVRLLVGDGGDWDAAFTRDVAFQLYHGYERTVDFYLERLPGGKEKGLASLRGTRAGVTTFFALAFQAGAYLTEQYPGLEPEGYALAWVAFVLRQLRASRLGVVLPARVVRKRDGDEVRDCEEVMPNPFTASVNAIDWAVTAAAAPEAPVSFIASLGNKTYQVGGRTAFVVGENENNVMTAFVGRPAMNEEQLIARSGVPHAGKVVRGLRRKYEDLKDQITTPGRKGKGGYRADVRRCSGLPETGVR